MESLKKQNKIEYVLGIDGGGSKTIARLEHLATQQSWHAVAGPSSLTNDFAGAVKVLKSLAEDLVNQAECQASEVSTVFGLAGACNQDKVAQLHEEFNQYFAMLNIFNDAKTSAYGANDGAEVAVIALGTGSVGMRLQKNDAGELKTTLVGGWGFLIGDEGGGAKLGYHAIKALVAELHHFGELKSPLCQSIAQHLFTKKNSVTRQDISAWLATAKPVDFAKLSPIVSQHQYDCIVAKDIISKHMLHVEALIADTRGNSDLPIVLVGGLANFTANLLAENTKNLIISAKGNALEGACFLAKKQINKL